jgi:hypothetical protein
MAKIDIQDIFPIVRIDQDLILSGAGDLTLGYELILPEIYTITKEEYDNIYVGFLNAFKNLPPGTVITQQDHYKKSMFKSGKEYDSFTLIENEKMLLDRGILLHKSYLFISVPDKKMTTIKASDNSVRRKPNFFSKVYDEFPKTLSTANQLAVEMKTSLESIDGVRAVRLNNDDLKSLVYKHWSNGEKYTKGALVPPIVEDKGFLKVNGEYIGTTSMINHGELVQVCKQHNGQRKPDDKDLKVEIGIDLQMGVMNQCGFGLPFDHVVQKTFVIRSKESMKLKLKMATIYESTFASFGWEESQKRIEDIKGFKSAVSNRGYNYCDASITVFVNEKDIDKLKNKMTEVKTVMRRINDCTVWEESYSDSLPIWVSATPGYGRANFRTFHTVMEHAFTYMNFDTNLRGSKEGHVYCDRLGAPITINLWKNKHIANKNGLVEGGSGTGKSVFVNTMVDQDLEMGYHDIIIDVGHSYEDQCEIKKGVYKDSRDLKSIGRNIFLCEKDGDGKWNPDKDQKLFVHSVILTIWKSATGKVSNATHSVLFDVVDSYYDHVNKTGEFPIFEHFYEYAKTMKFETDISKILDKTDFVAALKPFGIGRYKELLNSREIESLLHKKFIVFDIEAVSEDTFLFPIVGLVVMETALEKIRKLRGVKKRFIIDEGWKILKGEMAGFVEYLYRTIRKNEGSIWLATQAISDLPQNVGEEMTNALVNNADTVVLMRRGSTKNYPDLKKYLSLTESQVEMMKDMKKRDELGYREFFIKQGDYALILRNEVSPKTITVFDSEGDNKKELNRLYAETGNRKQCVNQFLENKQKQIKT